MKIIWKSCQACDFARVERIPRRWWMRLLPRLRPLQVAQGEPFVVAFHHAYAFESADGTHFDGGMIEVSSDDGMTWVDVATLGVDPGYGGTIAGETNPLFGRGAYVGTSPGLPARAQQVLDFGTQLAGETVRLRFRIGTDEAIGAPGWELDDLAFSGITNTPFATWKADGGHCSSGTTGDDTGGGSTTGELPTTGADTDATGGSGGSTSGPDGTDSGGQTGNDSGCGCVAGERRGLGALLPWLALAWLRPRRRR